MQSKSWFSLKNGDSCLAQGGVGLTTTGGPAATLGCTERSVLIYFGERGGRREQEILLPMRTCSLVLMWVFLGEQIAGGGPCVCAQVAKDEWRLKEWLKKTSNNLKHLVIHEQHVTRLLWGVKAGLLPTCRIMSYTVFGLFSVHPNFSSFPTEAQKHTERFFLACCRNKHTQ